jgi:hypothetical protein
MNKFPKLSDFKWISLNFFWFLSELNSMERFWSPKSLSETSTFSIKLSEIWIAFANA